MNKVNKLTFTQTKKRQKNSKKNTKKKTTKTYPCRSKTRLQENKKEIRVEEGERNKED